MVSNLFLRTKNVWNQKFYYRHRSANTDTEVNVMAIPNDNPKLNNIQKVDLTGLILKQQHFLGWSWTYN